MSNTICGYIWLRSIEWIGWSDATLEARYQAPFSPHDPHGCHEALMGIVQHIDPDHNIFDWIVIQGDQDRQERYDQWSQDPTDDFLANLNLRIDNDHGFTHYYKLITERPQKKVDYVVGAFRVANNIERMIELSLPRSSRIRWVPLGYLATKAKGIEQNPLIILISSNQTVALCMEGGEVRDIRVFQFCVDRCLDQLRLDHFSDNQARQLLEIDFSFMTYSQQERLLSLKIEVDQFIEDLKRLFLTRINTSKQPVWIAADAFSHHDVVPAIQALTANAVSILSEKEWVRGGGKNWGQNQERFLHIPQRKQAMMVEPPASRIGKPLMWGIVVILLVLIFIGRVKLKHRLMEQINQLTQTREDLSSIRAQYLLKLRSPSVKEMKGTNP